MHSNPLVLCNLYYSLLRGQVSNHSFKHEISVQICYINYYVSGLLTLRYF